MNAHHPKDNRWMLGIDSMKNSEIINNITSEAFISSDLFLIGYWKCKIRISETKSECRQIDRTY